jgi:hypothetical protein
MVEIFVAYIKGYSAYKIVTPYKSTTKVIESNCDEAVLEALRSTRSRNIVLITKSKVYELLSMGIAPRDDVQRRINKILRDKNVKFERIDSGSQRELVELMDKEAMKKKPLSTAKVEENVEVEEENFEMTTIPSRFEAEKIDDIIFDLGEDEINEEEVKDLSIKDAIINNNSNTDECAIGIVENDKTSEGAEDPFS